MRLLVDNQNIPGIISAYCETFSNQFGIDLKVVREREKDLYRKSSEDFDKEISKYKGYNSLKDILEDMQAGDILVTDDIELAKHAYPRVTTIIDSNGHVLSQKRIEDITIRQHLNRLQGLTGSKKIVSRSDDLNEKFKKTLYDFLSSIQN